MARLHETPRMEVGQAPRCPRCNHEIVYRMASRSFVCSTYAQTWCGWLRNNDRETGLIVLRRHLNLGSIRRVPW